MTITRSGLAGGLVGLRLGQRYPVAPSYSKPESKPAWSKGVSKPFGPLSSIVVASAGSFISQLASTTGAILTEAGGESAAAPGNAKAGTVRVRAAPASAKTLILAAIALYLSSRPKRSTAIRHRHVGHDCVRVVMHRTLGTCSLGLAVTREAYSPI